MKLFAPHNEYPGYFPIVDGFRAIACLSIIVYHCYFYFIFENHAETIQHLIREYPLLKLIDIAPMSLDTFFVISGFLISYYLLIEQKKTTKLSIRRFYLRRAWRLLPVYFIAMLVAFWLMPQNIENVWANLFYINNLLAMKQQYMLWTWSLAVEEQFYILIPLLLYIGFYLSPKRMIGVLLILFAIALSMRYWVISHNHFQLPLQLSSEQFFRYFDAVYDKLPTRMSSFLVGSFVAYLMVYTPVIDWLNARVKLSLFAYVVSIVAISLVFGAIVFESQLSLLTAYPTFFLAIFRPIYAVAIGYLILYAQLDIAAKDWLIRYFSAKGWYPIAQLSYSMYLFHYLIIAVVVKQLHLFNSITLECWFELVALVVCCSIVLALLIYTCIEKPCMNYRKRWS